MEFQNTTWNKNVFVKLDTNMVSNTSVSKPRNFTEFAPMKHSDAKLGTEKLFYSKKLTQIPD